MQGDVETRDVSAIARDFLRPLCRELIPWGKLSPYGTHWIDYRNRFKVCLKTGRAFDIDDPDNRHTIRNSNVISLWYLMACGGEVPDPKTDWTIERRADIRLATETLADWLAIQIDGEETGIPTLPEPEPDREEEEWKRNCELSDVMYHLLKATGRTEFTGSAESIRKLVTATLPPEEVPYEFSHFKPFTRFLEYVRKYPEQEPWFEITTGGRKRRCIWRITLLETGAPKMSAPKSNTLISLGD